MSSRKPIKVIQVPAENRSNVYFNTIKNLCGFWKNDTGCEIVPIKGYDNRVVRFDFYGSSTQAEAALRVVNTWLENANRKTAASQAWAKTPAFDANKWYYAEVEAMEADRKEMFKKPLPENVLLPEKVSCNTPKLITLYRELTSLHRRLLFIGQRS